MIKLMTNFSQAVCARSWNNFGFWTTYQKGS